MIDRTQSVHTRTTHTIAIEVSDDVLNKLTIHDPVEVILLGRGGSTLPKKLSYRDVRILLDENHN